MPLLSISTRVFFSLLPSIYYSSLLRAVAVSPSLCFRLSRRIGNVSSPTFSRPSLPVPFPSSQGSRVPREPKRHCGHWVVFHKVRSQVQAGAWSGSWSGSDPGTHSLIQVFHSERDETRAAFLFLSWRVSLLTGKEKPAPGAYPRGRLSRCSRPRWQKPRLKRSPCSKKTLCDTLVKVLFTTAPLPDRDTMHVVARGSRTSKNFCRQRRHRNEPPRASLSLSLSLFFFLS